MSKYGEVHDIFNQHHIQTKAKLDEILAKNSEIDVNTDELEAKIDTGNASLASFDGKVVACNTGAVVVSSSALPTDAATESSLSAFSAKVIACNTGAVAVASSALPSGAADSANQNDIKVLIAATNAALAGVLSVSAPAITKSSSTPVNSELIFGQSTYLSSEFDISAFKNLSLIGSSSDVMNSHEVDLLVSNVSGGTFFKTSHSGYYYEGAYHVLVSNHPYKYAKIQVKNADAAAGMSATFIVHALSCD
jgi:hypothetical protein